MKSRFSVAAMLMLATIIFTGCGNDENEEGRVYIAGVRQVIENKAVACLGEKNEKPKEIWSVNYDDERNRFVSASEKVCITHHGNIIHSICENYFPIPVEGQIYTGDVDQGVAKVIEYNVELMAIELDADEYRRRNNRNLEESSMVPYNKLREPEQHRMNRVASCLSSANFALKKATKNELH
jgi:hypothetical protein